MKEMTTIDSKYTHTQHTHPLVFLRRGIVERMTGLSRSAIYELIANEAFPKPIRVGKKAVRWVEHEINVWMNEKMARRD